MSTDLHTIRHVAELLADAARQEILPYFRSKSLGVASKGEGGFDPVTEADRAAEAAMRAILAVERPDDSILGEEFGATKGQSGLTWVLDPIDGTRAFIAGTPTWGVLIAVSDADGPIFGLIDQPYIGERFIGSAACAEMVGPLGGRALQTRAPKTLSEATLFTTFPEVGTKAERRAFEAVADQVKLVRYGCDCYAYALLAAGQIDLVIEAGLQAYDIQAPIAVIQAAGGLVTGWDGRPAHLGGRALAASHTALHAQVSSILTQAL